MTTTAAAPIRNAYVGSPVERLEDLRLLRGRGEYVDDVDLPNMLHAAAFRSPVAHGIIRKLDVSAALKRPGVHSVITAEDMGDSIPTIQLRLIPMEELKPLGQPVIAGDKVRYVGEIIAFVLAEDAAIAEDALADIEVEIEPLGPIPNRTVALEGSARLFDTWPTNEAIAYTAAKGDVDKAFAEAAYVRREKMEVQRHVALPMELRGIVAEWNVDDQRLTSMGAAKVPFANRRQLSAMLGIAESSIDLVENDVGGGFGARGELFPEDFLTAFAARKAGRPVKWAEDRRDHLQTMGHAREMDCDVEIACAADGTILGLRGDIWVDAGAYYRTNGTISPRNVAQFMSGSYRVPNVHLVAHAILTNKAPIGTYRGPGRFEADFFRERLFDIVARDMKIDPIEFRRRNLVTLEEMPYKLATLTPVEKEEELDSGDHHSTFDRCLKEFGWEEKKKLSGKLVDGVYRGIAAGCFIEGGAAGPRENARMTLETDGTISVNVGSTAVGQGLLTVLTQIAADALELPMNAIRLRHGSTSLVNEGFGSFHSRSTVMGGTAILLAANKLRDHIRSAAAAKLGCGEDAVEIVDGVCSVRGGDSVRIGDLAGDVPVVEEVFHNHKHTYSYGTVAAHVTVDPKTGGVRLLDMLMVEDVGRIVNPLTMNGQAVGGMVQGLGGAFLEHIVYDADAQLLTGSLMDYMVPLASDFPNIRAIVLGEHPSPISPLGVKGGGEGGTVPMGGLMANAVAAALESIGVEPRKLPLSPSNVWEMIQAARRQAAA